MFGNQGEFWIKHHPYLSWLLNSHFCVRMCRVCIREFVAKIVSGSGVRIETMWCDWYGDVMWEDSKSVPFWYHVPLWYHYKFDALLEQIWRGNFEEDAETNLFVVLEFWWKWVVCKLWVVVCSLLFLLLTVGTWEAVWSEVLLFFSI